MSHEEVAIPYGVQRQLSSIKETKALMDRYAKGRELFKEAQARHDMDTLKKLLHTFDDVITQTYLSMERTLMLQEYLVTGKAVVIPRDGSAPYKVDDADSLDNMIALDPYELQSVRALSETFGKDSVSFVNFDRLK